MKMENLQKLMWRIVSYLYKMIVRRMRNIDKKCEKKEKANNVCFFIRIAGVKVKVRAKVV